MLNAERRSRERQLPELAAAIVLVGKFEFESNAAMYGGLAVLVAEVDPTSFGHDSSKPRRQ